MSVLNDLQLGLQLDKLFALRCCFAQIVADAFYVVLQKENANGNLHVANKAGKRTECRIYLRYGFRPKIQQPSMTLADNNTEYTQ